LTERIEYVEKLLGDSVDKHAKWEAAHGNLSKLQKEQEARGVHHAALQERVDNLERALGDYGRKHTAYDDLQYRVLQVEKLVADPPLDHANWQLIHSKLDALEKKNESRRDESMSLQDRLSGLEKMSEGTGIKKKLDGAQSKLTALQRSHESQYSSIQDRLSCLETMMGDSSGIHSKWETRLAKSEKNHKTQNTFTSHLQERLDSVEKLLGDALDQSTRLEKAYSSLTNATLTKQQKEMLLLEHEASNDNLASVQSRLKDVEASLGDATNRYGKLDVAQAKLAKLQTDHEVHSSKYTELLARIQRCENNVNAMQHGATGQIVEPIAGTSSSSRSPSASARMRYPHLSSQWTKT
jgi:hypothetical protein